MDEIVGSQVAAGNPADAAAGDADYRAGVVDLLGILAYGGLTAFQRLSDDAATAPTLADQVMTASMAVAQFRHFESVRDHLWTFDVDVLDAMEPFHRPFDDYHKRAQAKIWLETLVSAYVGDGFAADFYREIAAYVDAGTRALVDEVLTTDRQTDYIVGRVRQAIADEPAVGGRLALWGRRLVGEALTQAQQVANERAALTGLLSGTVDRPGMDLAAIARMLTRLVENHALRMERLGLAS
ncbi:ferritin-like fold-containing protein [Granulicoccus sp. GXG6511]|uniref:ferritin-like fold-containing protein n=1 Tax=Granulicoccus sp. GXG6511 TaxID=3381351 RepID=UPI003D7EC612